MALSQPGVDARQDASARFPLGRVGVCPTLVLANLLLHVDRWIECLPRLDPFIADREFRFIVQWQSNERNNSGNREGGERKSLFLFLFLFLFLILIRRWLTGRL